MQDRFKFRTWHKPTNTMEYNGLWTGRDWDKKLTDCNIVIMQCTGLKDKNGKLIYEGDIIKNWDNRKYEIIWQNEAACFLVQNIKTKCKQGIYSLISLDNSLEVIGNIYENSELLEE